MSQTLDENRPVFQSISDRQAVLTQEKAAASSQASFSVLKAQYDECSALAKEEKEKSEETGIVGDYDEKLSQLLACEYRLRKSRDKNAKEFVSLHKPRYNFTFDIANDDIDEMNRAIDDPTFDWQGLKEKVTARDAEETAREKEDFLKALSADTDMTPKAEPAQERAAAERDWEITPQSPEMQS